MSIMNNLREQLAQLWKQHYHNDKLTFDGFREKAEPMIRKVLGNNTDISYTSLGSGWMDIWCNDITREEYDGVEIFTVTP